MSRKVLVTGGAGFIGSHTVPALRAQGCEVRVLDSLSPQIHGAIPAQLQWLTQPGVEFVRGSVTNRRDVSAALAGVTDVVHLAAETGTGQSMYEIERYNLVNSQATALLLDVLANAPARTVQRVVLASSRSVYGEGAYRCDACGPATRISPSPRTAEQLAAHRWEPECPACGSPLTAIATREDDAIRPASIYAATKFAQEELVRIACESLGMSYAILRFQNVYGEGQSLQNPYTGILSIFSTRVRRKLVLPIFEDGKETRDFVHVEDVARAVVAAVSKEGPLSGPINVGAGVGTSVEDIARQLTIALGREPQTTVTAQYRIGDIRHNFADITRLRTELGCTPQVSLQQGLKRLADWILQQPLPEDLLDAANKQLAERKLMK